MVIPPDGGEREGNVVVVMIDDEKTRFAASAIRASVECSSFDAMSSRWWDAIIVWNVVLPCGMFGKIEKQF